MATNLLTEQNAKTTKGEALGWRTLILYLSPGSLAGGGNCCPWASSGCLAACLYTAGRGKFSPVQEARLRKTREFWANPKGFVERLAREIERARKRAERRGENLAIRLNGTSDLPWERLGGEARVSLPNRFPGVVFYDYTKIPSRMGKFLAGGFPPNYSLTFSRNEENGPTADRFIDKGGSVAAVFGVPRGGDLPAAYRGKPVTDGDLTDLRFLDPAGTVVGLRAKGEALRDQSGFVIRDW